MYRRTRKLLAVGHRRHLVLVHILPILRILDVRIPILRVQFDLVLPTPVSTSTSPEEEDSSEQCTATNSRTNANACFCTC